MDIYTSSGNHPWEDHPETYLYFKKPHLKLQKEDYTVYSLGDPAKGGVMLPVFFNENMAYAPLRGHFGGLEVFGDVGEADLLQFLSKVLQDIRSRGIVGMEIKQAAECYSNNSSEIDDLLLNCGFFKKIEERNFHIHVSEKLFVDHLHHSEKRKLNKCYEAQISMQVLGNLALDEAYELIRLARDEKDRPMSLSFEALSKLMKVYPDEHLVFLAYDKDVLIAANICIRNHKNVLYSFLPAHLSAYNHLSPLVILYEFIYNHSFNNGIEILDLGIATEDGIDNEGLIRFKKNLGGQESAKVTYAIEL